MARFVKKGRHKLVRIAPKQRVQDHHLWHRVERTTGVSPYAARRASGSKENDGIPAQFNIELERGTLFIGHSEIVRPEDAPFVARSERSGFCYRKA